MLNVRLNSSSRAHQLTMVTVRHPGRLEAARSRSNKVPIILFASAIHTAGSRREWPPKSQEILNTCLLPITNNHKH